MFAARPGSAVNGYALPLTAASVADLLTAVGLTFAALGFLGLGRAPLAPSCAAMCATRKSLATAGGRQQWNVGGGE
jgi:ABC-type dipeptide/oligopeptide/nickel transport system permease subunit